MIKNIFFSSYSVISLRAEGIFLSSSTSNWWSDCWHIAQIILWFGCFLGIIEWSWCWKTCDFIIGGHLAIFASLNFRIVLVSEICHNTKYTYYTKSHTDFLGYSVQIDFLFVICIKRLFTISSMFVLKSSNLSHLMDTKNCCNAINYVNSYSKCTFCYCNSSISNLINFKRFRNLIL